MNIIKDSDETITALASEGRCTLQVPDIAIGGSVQYDSLPDEWFCYLNNNLPTTSYNGFLYLTRTGYEKNKKKLLLAYSFNNRGGGNPIEFDAYAQLHFSQVEKAVEKKITNLSKQINKLRKFSV